VSSPRPPSARQAPKLNKGSPLPRQRPVVCSRATTTSLAQLARTTQDHRRGRPLPSRRTLPNDRSNHPDEHDRISPHPDSLRFPPVRSSHPCCIARIVKTKKPPRSPLHRLARPRVTRRLHHPPSGLSDRARVVGPPRAAPIAGLPPVSLISQVLDLITPYALRLTQPVRRRPSPFGPSCISSRHLDRIGSLIFHAQPAFVNIPGSSSRPLGVCSSTKLDCIQDIGILTFTALPPWSRPCGLASIVLSS
jgi:hypothetical protein